MSGSALVPKHCSSHGTDSVHMTWDCLWEGRLWSWRHQHSQNVWGSDTSPDKLSSVATMHGTLLSSMHNFRIFVLLQIFMVCHRRRLTFQGLMMQKGWSVLYLSEGRKAWGQLTLSMFSIKTLQFSHAGKLDSLWAMEVLIFYQADFAFPVVPWAFRSKLICGFQSEKHLDGRTPLSLILLGLLTRFHETMCFACLRPASLSCPHLCKGLSHTLKPY